MLKGHECAESPCWSPRSPCDVPRGGGHTPSVCCLLPAPSRRVTFTSREKDPHLYPCIAGAVPALRHGATPSSSGSPTPTPSSRLAEGSGSVCWGPGVLPGDKRDGVRGLPVTRMGRLQAPAVSVDQRGQRVLV